ncbi:MAG TPA: HAMP domain-containing sensor histidine kinase [Mucilaginibacter sp.]|nr:HAMP domain-containing sensor histidine kinase [Mucilaginibacter sp.]
MRTINRADKLRIGRVPAIKASRTHKGRLFAAPNIPNRGYILRRLETAQNHDFDSARLAGLREKEVNLIKKRFLTMTSREFRTPLNAILLSADLIEQYYDSFDKQKIFSELNKIKTAAMYMADMTNDFISVEKIETGRLQAEPAIFDIKSLAESVIHQMKKQTKDWQDIRYVHAGPQSNVSLDRELIQHCLVNLISNAIKYSDVADHIEVETEIAGDFCIIRVKDSGIGIPKEEQQRLFEPFFRASNASHTEGTGLGLNIVKRYAELMGGYVNVESTENQGSVFTLVLPVTPFHRKQHDQDHARL